MASDWMGRTSLLSAQLFQRLFVLQAHPRGSRFASIHSIITLPPSINSENLIKPSSCHSDATVQRHPRGTRDQPRKPRDPQQRAPRKEKDLKEDSGPDLSQTSLPRRGSLRTRPQHRLQKRKTSKERIPASYHLHLVIKPLLWLSRAFFLASVAWISKTKSGSRVGADKAEKSAVLWRREEKKHKSFWRESSCL